MTGKQKRMLARISASALMTAALLIFSPEGYLSFGLWMTAYLIIGYDILYDAARGIASGQLFDENFLMAVATVGAIVLALMGRGDYTEAVAVMLFYQIGEFFQDLAVRKSRRSIGALMDIRPDIANMETEQGVMSVSPEDVPIGSVIVVKSGEKIAIDGIIVEGESAIDTSALSGESLPRNVGKGERVLAGCINLYGVLRVRTDREFGETAASKILELVENASSKKAKSEGFITRFAKYYTPAVCAAALALALLPPLVLSALGAEPMWTEWLYRALTFLVISCPCALVVSIPLTFFATLGGASREGVLIKGSTFIEALAGTECVAFDKTGTLTRGNFEVSAIHPVGVEEAELLYFSAHAESASPHPIAKSLCTAYGRETEDSRVTDIRELFGRGVSARVDGREVLVGSGRLMKENGILPHTPAQVGTAVHIGIDRVYAGYIVISDVMKENASEAIEALHSVGVKRTVMLTGDSEAVAKSIGERAGVDEIHWGLLPDGKVEALERLLSEKGRTVFAGDGINDAPVLTRADVGIAMGGAGSDAAVEAADAVIMNDDIGKIAVAVFMSKRCMRIVWQNSVFAIGVKLICLLLGALGIANMYLAIFADVGVMVLAVLNAIRAMSRKKFEKILRGG